MRTSSSSLLLSPKSPTILRTLVAATPTVGPLHVFGAMLEPDGAVTLGSERCEVGDGILNVELTSNFLVSKAPGQYLRFTDQCSGAVKSLAYVDKYQQWFNSNRQFLAESAACAPQKVSRRLWRTFVRNLCSRLGARHEWCAANPHPYEHLFKLKDCGIVELANGVQLYPGDSPVLLPTGETLLRTGLDVTLHAKSGDVLERFRQTSNAPDWLRLITIRLEPWSTLSLPVTADLDGNLTFSSDDGLPFTVAARTPVVLHLSDRRRLVRLTGDNAFWLYDSSGQVREFSVVGDSLFSRSGARDTWILTMVGCPGDPQHRTASVEIMAGAITLCAPGTVIILGRCYLRNEPIALQTASLRVERDGGAGQALFIRTGTSVIGYLYAGGEWWLATPRAADRSWFIDGAENPVACGFQWIERFVANAPGMHWVDKAFEALGRTSEGLASQPLLAHIGVFAAIGLAFILFVGYWARLALGVPYSIVWRIARHIHRAFILS